MTHHPTWYPAKPLLKWRRTTGNITRAPPLGGYSLVAVPWTSITFSAGTCLEISGHDVSGTMSAPTFPVLLHRILNNTHRVKLRQRVTGKNW